MSEFRHVINFYNRTHSNRNKSSFNSVVQYSYTSDTTDTVADSSWVIGDLCQKLAYETIDTLTLTRTK